MSIQLVEGTVGIQLVEGTMRHEHTADHEAWASYS